jgi:acetate kinase
MDTILVIDAHASSISFHTFIVEGEGRLRRHLSGELDGLGHDARFNVSTASGNLLANRAYPAENVADVSAACEIVAAWLWDELGIRPLAVGHRVVQAGPGYDRPMLIDQSVMLRLEQPAGASSYQTYELAPIRLFRTREPTVPQVACFDADEEGLMIAQHTLALLFTRPFGRMPSSGQPS